MLATKAQDLATRGYVGTLKGLPKDLATKIHTTGVDGSLTEVARLARQYKLTPKQIVTLIKAEGIEPTKAAINSVASTMKSVAGRASGYGSSAGSAYGSGFVGGISAWTGRAEFAAMAMAGAAHAAAMRELNAHSPSRKMIQVGKWFSQGFAIGIEKDASKVLNSVDTLFGKLDKKQRPAIKRLTAQYISGKHGLNAIARAQADVNNRLQDAQQKLADAKQAWKDYRDSVKTSIVAFGNITELGKNSAGNATADGIVKQLQARAAAVEKYKALVEQLKKEHLNGTALQQILDAGVDGGLQTAMAIEQGGPAVIARSTTCRVRSLRPAVGSARRWRTTSNRRAWRPRRAWSTASSRSSASSNGLRCSWPTRWSRPSRSASASTRLRRSSRDSAVTRYRASISDSTRPTSASPVRCLPHRWSRALGPRRCRPTRCCRPLFWRRSSNPPRPCASRSRLSSWTG